MSNKQHAKRQIQSHILDVPSSGWTVLFLSMFLATGDGKKERSGVLVVVVVGEDFALEDDDESSSDDEELCDEQETLERGGDAAGGFPVLG